MRDYIISLTLLAVILIAYTAFMFSHTSGKRAISSVDRQAIDQPISAND